MRTETLRLVLMGGLVMSALGAGCADQALPCGKLPGNQEARDRACTDSDFAQFHLEAEDCDASYITDTFKPAWCEVGCTPAPSETGRSCSNAFNPFSRTTVDCTATHDANGLNGCCVTAPKGMLTDPVWGTSTDAVMFFSCP